MDELKHYGVIGQKWGVITKRESTLREKARNVVKVQGRLASKTSLDVSSAEWMQKSVSQKAFSTLKTAAIFAAVDAIMYGTMAGKIDIKGTVVRSLEKTSRVVATQEYAGRSSLRRYEDSGKRNMAKRQYKTYTPELAGAIALNAAMQFSPVAARVAKAGLQKAAYDHKKNREAYEDYVAKQRESGFKAVYDDGYMAVLQKVKP